MTNQVINGSSVPTNPNAFTGYSPVYCIAPVPLARVAANGFRYLQTLGLYLHGGSGGDIATYFADPGGGGLATSGLFPSVASGSWNTGWRNASKVWAGIVPGWEMQIGFIHSGTLRYGRHSAGGNVYEGGGVGWTGASLSGEFSYAEVPPAPTMLGVSRLTNGLTRVQFQGNGDGGLPITRWLLQYSKSSTFSSGVTTIESSGTSDINLGPGLWYFRSAGCNSLADAYGTSSPWSSTMSFTVSGVGKRFTAGAFTPVGTAKRFNGTSFVDLTTKKKWNGSAWVDLTST